MVHSSLDSPRSGSDKPQRLWTSGCSVPTQRCWKLYKRSRDWRWKKWRSQALLFVPNKLTPFWNAPCLKILFQLALWLPQHFPASQLPLIPGYCISHHLSWKPPFFASLIYTPVRDQGDPCKSDDMASQVKILLSGFPSCREGNYKHPLIATHVLSLSPPWPHTYHLPLASPPVLLTLPKGQAFPPKSLCLCCSFCWKPLFKHPCPSYTSGLTSNVTCLEFFLSPILCLP